MRKHPDLGKKLSALYRHRLNPSVLNNVELGRRLGVSKQAVSRWCRGTATQAGDSIPNNQLIPLSNIFGIEPLWFTLSLPEFETAIQSRVSFNERGKINENEMVSISMMPNTGLNIVGREAEIEVLNDCWQSNTTNVVQIVAFGGVGKSSLVNLWLSKLSKERYRYATRVYAWSFHWQGDNSDVKASGDSFIEHALQWFGDDDPNLGSPWSKAVRLARLIRAHRSLIILDGIEVLQNPPGKNSGQINSPAVALFLKELAVENDGLCVLTTRLKVSDLEAYEDGRSELLQLGNLTESAGVEALKSFGVVGDERAYLSATKAYSGHALSLSLLAGYSLIVFDGEIRRFAELRSLLNEKDHSDQIRQIMETYIEWFRSSPELDILYLVSLSDSAINLGDLKQLVKISEGKGFTGNLHNFDHSDWSYAISKLEHSNLLQVTKKTDDIFLDCHPIVRDFLIDRARSQYNAKYRATKGSLFDFRANKISSSPESPKEKEQLFRAVISGTQAGRYKEAFKLYYSQVKKGFVMLSEGCHYMDQACIESFFLEDWDGVNDSLTQEQIYYLKSSSAANLMTLGRIDEAIGPAKDAIKYFVENGSWQSACQTAGPLVSAMIEAGKLEEALLLLNSLEIIISDLGDPVISALAKSFRAYALFLAGNYCDAEELFIQAEKALEIKTPKFDVMAPIISAYYSKYLIEIGETEKAIERLLRAAAWRARSSWQVTFDTVSLEASDMLVLGQAFMEIGDLTNACRYLNKQVELFRSANEWLYLPTGLNSRAMYFLEIEDYSLAESDLEESIDISKRTGAKFGEWGAYIQSASLCLKTQSYDQGLFFLEKAEELPGMESYKFRRNQVEFLKEQLQSNLARV